MRLTPIGRSFLLCAAVLSGAGAPAQESPLPAAVVTRVPPDRSKPRLFPEASAANVNPDTHLTISFGLPPSVGKAGKIRIVDAQSREVIDEIDLAIPPSPNPTGRVAGANGETKAPRPPAPAGPENPAYQYDRIGGTYYHFFPVIVRGNRATITPHHGKLKYGRKYIVQIDPTVLTIGDEASPALPEGLSWTFATKAKPPAAGTQHVVVAQDGSGDFNTLQGAIDFAPQHPRSPFTIDLRNGYYEELVNISDRSNLVIRGENRARTIVGYANNSAFNRVRPAFMVSASNDIQLSNFTINNYFIGQAEALLMRGERNIVDRMTLNGSGDAFTTYGTIYMVDSKLTGDGDTILGYAALFCLRCEIRSAGPFTWTRTPERSHGNVFVDSTFIYEDKPLPWSITPHNPAGRKAPGVLARLPQNGPPGSPHANFPHAEMVLIDSRMNGIPPIGWGPVEEESANFDRSDIRFWEYGSRDLEGHRLDLSKRHPIVRVLTLPRDAQIIADYRRPEFVLGGWKPVVR